MPGLQCGPAGVAPHLSQLRAVAVPQFSVSRTLGLIGGLGAVVVAAVLLAPDPVYAIDYR